MAIAGDNPGDLLCPTLAHTRFDGRHGLSRQFAYLMSAVGLDQDQKLVINKGRQQHTERQDFYSER